MATSDARESARTRRMNVTRRREGGVLRAVGYARVSTEYQVERLSFDWQEGEVRRAVAAHGWELESVVREQASGKSVRGRPLLASLLERLDDGELDALVVAKLDRLSRSALDFYELMDRAHRKGWVLLCLAPRVDMSDPFGRAAAGVAMIFAELERDLISQRQKDSIQARREAGTYREPPRLISPDAEERIAFLAGEGMGPRRIARQLELEGFEPPAGRKWYPTSVARIAARQRAA
jgi:DNA invertase Pin-like site-specific DNA recombinase